ncbi:uncharacterized protein BO87DRAFT_378110 [Aspergillus neoniger CBS 115656]|uniref:Uncharacterized protein n=1 Tax=Aspergillus neoniger (strain CBS 115656) TaxID=1448310 RepID=A0A318YXP1_ASPNB|nr:hypothetical protein BO87DRAFT_378110 [Aspergillus neoniger CBS 115656]PYH32618.1 hypothetical protein BO87DRAFT_378110 [Aspergillus neoniger CBS 115656]
MSHTAILMAMIHWPAERRWHYGGFHGHGALYVASSKAITPPNVLLHDRPSAASYDHNKACSEPSTGRCT